MESSSKAQSNNFLPAIALAIAACACVWAFIAVNGRSRPAGGPREYQLAFDGTTARMAGLTMGRISFMAVINFDRFTQEDVYAACDRAWTALDSVNRTMNPYDSESSLSKINAADADVAVTVEPELFTLLMRSRDLSGQTLGCFDPSCRALFEFYKQQPKDAEFPSSEQITGVLDDCGWDNFGFVLSDGGPGVKKTNAASQIDLGAIAKGYAVDMALRAFRDAGFDGSLIEVGGEVSVYGSPSAGKDGWVIGLNDPFEPDLPDGSPNICGKLKLTGQAAVATSGDYRRFMELGGRRFSHIIDPRYGLPAGQTHSVTVIADNCELADALATALSVSGPELMDEIIARIRTEGDRPEMLIEAMIISGTPEDCHVSKTSGFDKLLVGELAISGSKTNGNLKTE